MKSLWAFAFLLVSCSAMPAEAAPLKTPLAKQESMPTVTMTTVPTPTVPTPTPNIEVSALQTQVAGLQAGFVNLQTSNEQNRDAILAQIADNEKQRVWEQTQVAVLATSTALPIFLEIERVKLDEMKEFNRLEANRATQTVYAPTAVEVVRVMEYKRKYGERDAFIEAVGKYVVMFSFVIAAFLLILVRALNQPLPEKTTGSAEPELPFIVPTPDPAPVVLELKQGTHQYPSGEFVKLPCTAEEFTTLVNELENGRTWGYNNWQGGDSPIPFKKWNEIRQACLVNRWVISVPNSDKRLMNTALGDRVFEAWRERQETLGFEFTESKTL